jgi:cysteine-rich repeat protein
MRTPFALLVGSLLVGCTVGDPGPGGGDDTTDNVCGDNVVAGSEECDDGNAAGGDGCSATCTTEPIPRLDMVVDKQQISTELNKSHMITVTLVGSGGFGGAVNLTASAVDANNVAIPGWTIAFPNPTVNVPVDGSVDAVGTLTIPSENRGLTGTVVVDATSALGPKSTRTAVTALNQVSLEVTMNGNGQCVYTSVMGQTRVTVGTKIRMVNKGTDTMIFHSDGGARGVPHQDTNTTTAVNAAYENTIGSAGNAFNWYCHSPGPNPGNAVQILPVAPQ